MGRMNRRIVAVSTAILAIMALKSCTNAFEVALQSSVEANEVVPPVPGDAGAISAVAETGLVDLSWTPAADNATDTKRLEYQVYYTSGTEAALFDSTEEVLRSGTLAKDWVAATTSVRLFLADGDYLVNVLVRDVAGNVAAYAGLATAPLPDTEPPTAGGLEGDALSVDGTTLDSVALSWNAASDNALDPDQLVYSVYQSSTDDMTDVTTTQLNGDLVASGLLGQTSYTVTGLTPGTTYWFNVLVRDSNPTQLDAYAQAMAMTATDVTPPVVTNGTVTLNVEAYDQVTVSWGSGSADDDTTDFADLEFAVYYDEDPMGGDPTETGTPFGAWQSGITSVLITGLSEATRYYFNVVVRDVAGNDAAYSESEDATDVRKRFVYAATFSANLESVLPDGSSPWPIVGVSANPFALAVDSTYRKVYWVSTEGDVFVVDLEVGASAETVLTGLSGGDTWMAVDEVNGNIYIADKNDDKIYRVPVATRGADTGTSSFDLSIPFVSAPTGIDVDPVAGKIYWVEFDAENVRHANLDGTAHGDFAVDSHVDDPTGLDVFEIGANRYVAWINTGTGAQTVKTAQILGSSLSTVHDMFEPNTFGQGYDIVVDSSAGLVYLSSFNGSIIFKLDLPSHGQSPPPEPDAGDILINVTQPRSLDIYYD